MPRRSFFTDVLDYYRKFSPRRIGEFPNVPKYTLITRVQYLAERLGGLMKAADSEDIAGVASGIADSIDILLGIAVECGIEMDSVWREVHATNMTKEAESIEGGIEIIRTPEGWRPPDINRCLRNQVNLTVESLV